MFAHTGLQLRVTGRLSRERFRCTLFYKGTPHLTHIHLEWIHRLL
jgi:hypothetical protein